MAKKGKSKFSTNQWIGIILLIAAILMYAPLGPLGLLSWVGPLIVVLAGLYLLFN
jgi:hypothetical protein